VTAGTPPALAETRSRVATSSYREALDATLAVLQRRARNLRNLVVVVVLIGVASLAGALVTRPASGLAGLLILVPACGFFFFADAMLLGDWRSALVASWVRGEVDFAAFRDALRATPSLPTETTEAMLETLPSAGDLVAEQSIHGPTRQALAAANRTMHRARADTLLLNAAASAVAIGMVAVAIWTRHRDRCWDSPHSRCARSSGVWSGTGVSPRATPRLRPAARGRAFRRRSTRGS
jgi:hypothetical protein